MKRTGSFIAIALVIPSTLFYACAQPPLISPTATITPMAPASSTPVPTSTFTPIPTATSTPEPPPIPGVQVYPLESLSNGIPWLPSDKNNNPMSVYYGFNLMKPPFNSVPVRQAFGSLSVSTRKEIRTNQHHFSSILALQNSKSIHFFLYSNLNIDKNRSTLSVGGFREMDAPSWICSEPHPSLKSVVTTTKGWIFESLMHVWGWSRSSYVFKTLSA